MSPEEGGIAFWLESTEGFYGEGSTGTGVEG